VATKRRKHLTFDNVFEGTVPREWK